MRLKSILCTALLMSALCLSAQKVTVKVVNTKVETILNVVSKQTGLSPAYNRQLLKSDRLLTLNIVNGDLTQVLDAVVAGVNLAYEVKDKTIYFFEKKGVEDANQSSKSKTISGTVLDERGEPVIGANVSIKGTTIGTISDMDGRFELDVIQGQTLLISYIGYLTKEDVVTEKSIYKISMVEDLMRLDEVVVVGYGAQKRESLTGSVATVKGADILKSPSMNVTNSLAGQLPGVTVNTRSGEPGRDASSIYIRGRSTTGNASALIIIDGVERSDLGQINPNDIESISVLKDASAAIYGARAANGVILVTTKRGKQTKPMINVSFNQGFTQPTRKTKMADSYTFAKVSNEIEVGEGREPKYTNDELAKYGNGSDPNYPNTNWYDYMIKSLTPQHRTNVSISGGTDRVNYYLSIGEAMQKGQFTGGTTDVRQYNVRSNVDVKVTEDLKIGLDISGRLEQKHYPYEASNNLYSHIFLYWPSWQPYWPGTDKMMPNRDSENILNWVNDNAGWNNQDIKTVQSTLFFKWDVPYVKGLSVEGSGSYDASNNFTKVFRVPTYVYYKDGTTGELYRARSGAGVNMSTLSDRSDMSALINLTAKVNYQRSFGDHNVGALLGYEQIQTTGNWFSAYRSDFVSTQLPQIFAGSSDKNKQGNDGNASQGARQNAFIRLNYDYAGRYLAEFTFRRDGSPNFPSNKRYGYFPSASLGWRLSEEAFMKSVDFINNLKIRGSFGMMGNDLVNSFQYLTTYGFGNNYVIGGTDVTGLVQTGVPNPNITWETAKTWNMGVDATLWDGLFGVEFDYFNTRRSNILTKRSAIVPSYTGLSLPDENIGIVDNRGVELILRHANRTSELKYSFAGNFAYARNEVVFSDEQPGAEPYQLATGRPIGSSLYYNAIGIFKDQADIDSYPHLLGTRPGDIKYADTNNDKIINSLDRIREDFTNIPQITFGLTANFEYKGFDLTVLLQGQENVKQYFGGWFPNMSTSFGNFTQWRANDHWSPENTDATMPRGTDATGGNNTLGSTQWLVNAGFLRVKNVELGYNLPRVVCSKLKIENLRVSLGGNNLFIIYDHMKDLGFDPETNDYWFYSPVRTYNVGINLTF